MKQVSGWLAQSWEGVQALTYDVRRERDREVKEFMQNGAAAIIQVTQPKFSNFFYLYFFENSIS